MTKTATKKKERKIASTKDKRLNEKGMIEKMLHRRLHIRRILEEKGIRIFL